MNILALIPARGGSKGIPRKNIVELGGQPLIWWTIKAARAARGITRVVVSTDDQEIADIAIELGAEAPFLRPGDISGDTAPALPVIQHALKWYQERDRWYPDAVAYLQPTSPFRTGAHLDAAIGVLNDRDADTVVSVTPVPHNMTPSSLMQLDDGWLSFAAPVHERQFRRQSKATLYARNGPAILISRRGVVEGGQLYGERIAGYEMSRLASLDIDEPDDVEIAEALFDLAMGEGVRG